MTIKPLSKIILTDDEEDILTIAQFSLEELKGVEIKYCHCGQETIKEALKFRPDLIILDVMMPTMDGLATLEALKLLPDLAQVPVIFLTAKARKEEVEDYRRRGAIDIIAKPFDPLTLADTINRIWESYQLQHS